jgi:mRNA interferase RelE/StbE
VSWEIRYRASVEKDAQRLPADAREAVLAAIAQLESGPFPKGCKKLKGAQNRYRLKVAGAYRVVYSLYKEERRIVIEFVGHRKDAYRWL